MAVHLHLHDLPAGLSFGPMVAIDTETMGLIPGRDRLCLVQLSDGQGDAHLVKMPQPDDDSRPASPNLIRLLTDPAVVKLFHFARFDIAILLQNFDVMTAPIYCTKIASRLVRTYTDRHGLKELCRELLGIELSKEQQSSDWGAANLSVAQCNYAAADVLHLHALHARLTTMLQREGRTPLAEACFAFLPARAQLDLLGWTGDIFDH